MRARLLKLWHYLGDAFWLLPAAVVLAMAALGWSVVELQQRGLVPGWLPNDWVYGGGETGARTLLGAIASSTIGVAGTIFSITIAALTLASNQMGPRLLRNFTRDRGNQLTLGVLLGTFAYALLVLRTVRDGDSPFVPSLGVSVGLLLAAWCIGMVIYFVHHVAARMNVDTVIDLVHADLSRDVLALTETEAGSPAPDESFWRGAATVVSRDGGYLQEIDARNLVQWAREQEATVRLLAGPGDFVFPGSPMAEVQPPVDGASAAVRGAVALSASRASDSDLTRGVRQLVEVAVRALSPGVNDPLTAITVLDRLGATLCQIAPRRLGGGVTLGDGRTLLVIPVKDYRGLLDQCFSMIIACAGPSPAVMLRIVQVLEAVALVEGAPDRLASLRDMGDRVVAEGRRRMDNPYDREALEAAYARLLRTASAASSPA